MEQQPQVWTTAASGNSSASRFAGGVPPLDPEHGPAEVEPGEDFDPDEGGEQDPGTGSGTGYPGPEVDAEEGFGEDAEEGA